MDDVNEQTSDSPAGGSDPPSEPVSLDALRRTRDALETAMVYSGRAELAFLETLRDLSDECRQRGGPSEPDALDRLVFRWRQRQAQREAAVSVVRRGRTRAQEASA